MGSAAPPAAAPSMRMLIFPNAKARSAPPRSRFCIQSWPLNVVVLSIILAALFPATASAAATGAGPNPIAANSLFTPAATSSPGATDIFIHDSRTPVKQDGHWTYLSEADAEDLRRRGSDDDTDTTTSTSAVKTSTSKTSSTKSNPKTGTTTTVTKSSTTSNTSTATASTSALPKFFDSSLAANFSSSGNCPMFIKAFLANSTFNECYPFSLLLQGSTSFFNAEKSLVTITQVLDKSCAANVTFCASYLDDLATELISSDSCGDDYKLSNAVVLEAYLGMLAYQVIYSATCLKDSATSQYCFGNAITNLTTPANAYFYYLPLNISLPGGSMPSCNTCLKRTMAVFRAASADRSQPIADTYVAAAQQVDELCGPTFANATLPASSSANSYFCHSSSWSWLTPTLFSTFLAYLLL